MSTPQSERATNMSFLCTDNRCWIEITISGSIFKKFLMKNLNLTSVFRQSTLSAQQIVSGVSGLSLGAQL